MTDTAPQALPVVDGVSVGDIQPLLVLSHRVSDSNSATTIEECTYYILGTAHVSSSSCDDVRRLVRAVRPDVVVVELCFERQAILQHNREALTKAVPLSDAIEDIRSGRATPFQAIYSWLLAKIGSGLDVAPGEEFRVAVEEAREVGASVVLGDRPVGITVARVWGALSLWEKWKLTGTLLWSGLTLNNDEVSKELERMKGSDVLTEAIKEFGKEFPKLIAPLLTERDLFMVHVMRQLASEGKKVVAVVGAGHLEGIKAMWNEEVDMKEICSKPKPRTGPRWGRIMLVTMVSCITMYSLARWRRR